MAKYTNEIEQIRNNLALLVDLATFPHVISIERMDIGEAGEHTILAYVQNHKITQWFLYCSRKQHNLLAKNHAARLAKRELDGDKK